MWLCSVRQYHSIMFVYRIFTGFFLKTSVCIHLQSAMCLSEKKKKSLKRKKLNTSNIFGEKQDI